MEAVLYLSLILLMDVYPGTGCGNRTIQPVRTPTSGYPVTKNHQIRVHVSLAGRDNKFDGRLTFTARAFSTRRLFRSRAISRRQRGWTTRAYLLVHKSVGVDWLSAYADGGNYGALPHVHVGRHVRDACRLHVIKHRMITGGGSDASASSPAEARSRDAPCPLNVRVPPRTAALKRTAGRTLPLWVPYDFLRGITPSFSEFGLASSSWLRETPGTPFAGVPSLSLVKNSRVCARRETRDARCSASSRVASLLSE